MSNPGEHRKLAAIMFTDMVGYSALSQRDDKLALELLEEHRRLLREIFPRFHGTEIKTIGDAFLVEFNSALEAAQCAIEIQRALGHHNHDVSGERHIELKIGIHIGDVVHRGGDVYGDGVNIASRIEPLAGAGGICISMDVERQIRNAVETRFEKLAPTELKNISVPMELFRIVLPWERKSEIADQKSQVKKSFSTRRVSKFAFIGAVALLLIGGIGWWFTHRGNYTTSTPRESEAAIGSGKVTGPIPEKSIAVLPFENLSSDKDNAYFAEGIQDEILTRLSKIAALKVISRTSTQKYKSAPDNLRDIAQRLGVANILEGSVQKAGDQVRVTVQLINAISDMHLWADTYDRKLTDIFSVESEIARTVAETLQAKLTGSAKQALASKPTENPEAHELYLKGRYFWNRRTEENLKKALGYFQQAIEKDPSYALAYSGIADCYALMPVYSSNPPKEDIQRAIAAARRALELDDNLAEAHTSLGNALNTDSQFVGAEVEFRRAIALNPNYATLHQWFGECLQAQGRFEEALVEAQRAYDLDPLSLIINVILASTLDGAGRPDEALQQIHRTIDLDPNFGVAYWVLGQILENKGDLKGAADAYEKAEQAVPSPLRLAVLASVYARTGRSAEARKILNELTAKSQHQFVPSYPIALIHVALGDNEQALQLLEKAYDERSIQIGGNTGSLKIDKRLDPLRSDPRFQKLLARSMSKAQ